MFFFISLCPHTNSHSHIVTSTCMYASVTVVIDMLVVVHNKMWDNRVTVFISSWSVTAGYEATMLTEGAKVDLSLTHQL